VPLRSNRFNALATASEGNSACSEPGANHFTDTCPDVAGRETREGRLMNVPHDENVQKFRELLGDQLRSPDHG